MVTSFEYAENLFRKRLPEFTALRETSPVHQALRRLEAAVRLFGQLPADSGLHDIAWGMHLLCRNIEACERRGAQRELILDRLDLARRIHRESPFIFRLQQWPRGYPGDFETIDYLVSGHNAATKSPRAFWLEHNALHSPVAQQHRNKIDAQCALECDESVVPAHGRLLSLATGGSLDLIKSAFVLRQRSIQVILNDFDPTALKHSLKRLGRLGIAAKAVPGNALAAVRALRRESARFDLVVAGGLFDYLSDKEALFLLKTIHMDLLSIRGTIFWTNIAAPNPYRVWMEYLADWRLKERSEADVKRLMEEAGFAASDVRVTRDVTGLALLIRGTRNRAEPRVVG